MVRPFRPRNARRRILCMASYRHVGPWSGVSAPGRWGRLQSPPPLRLFFSFALKSSGSQSENDTLYEFQPPEDSIWVRRLFNCLVHGFLPEGQGITSHGIQCPAKSVQIGPNIPCLHGKTAHSCRLGTGDARRSISIFFVQFPARFACEPIRIGVPFSPQSQFFSSSTSPRRAT